MQWVGLDIGGANLKLADGNGYADSHPFALWRDQHSLTHQLRMLIAQAPGCSHLAVTMTAELADCFQTKREGVCFILNAVEQAADGRHTRVYQTSGQMVTPRVASRRPGEVAAANWHALAVYAGRQATAEFALAVDVGSTTTDIVPLLDGQVVASGYDDTTRLAARELVYMGVKRTPLCALLDEAPYREQTCPVAREVFATARDAFLILGDLAEDPASRETADGRPATKSAARLRLGRMVCADSDSFNHRDAVVLARASAEVQVAHLATAIDRVITRHDREPATVILAGEGEFLAQRALQRLRLDPQLIRFSQLFNPAVSRCAPAHALAVLAREATQQ